jgi:hypothetical protein
MRNKVVRNPDAQYPAPKWSPKPCLFSARVSTSQPPQSHMLRYTYQERKINEAGDGNQVRQREILWSEMWLLRITSRHSRGTWPMKRRCDVRCFCAGTSRMKRNAYALRETSHDLEIMRLHDQQRADDTCRIQSGVSFGKNMEIGQGE